jgi:hypothetical protein
LTQKPPEPFQPSEDYESALSRAARLWGIEPEYWDIWGNRHQAPLEVQRSILHSLGIPADTREELDAAIEERLWRDWSQVIAPTIVLSRQAHEITIQIPESLGQSSAEIHFAFENGENSQSVFALPSLPDQGRASLRGETFVRKFVPLPAGLPLGYHNVDVQIRTDETVSAGGVSRLIVCPDRAYEPEDRSAGIAVSVYSLRSGRNWGCGDFADLYRIIDWAATDLNAGFVGLNPLHAIPNRQPYNTSPYLPVCTFYRNPLYLDVERIEDFANSRCARRLFESARVQDQISALRAEKYVEYERVYRLKLRFLKLLFRSFLQEMRANTPRSEAFRRFIQSEGDLLDQFAVYCALDEAIHKRNPNIWIWPDWPAEFRDPNSPETAAFAKKHWRTVLFHKYIQWQVDLQLQDVQRYAKEMNMPIGLYHDLALATDRCGSDLWAHRDFYVNGCRVGSPPDGFAPKGQDWAFPPPNSIRAMGWIVTLPYGRGSVWASRWVWRWCESWVWELFGLTG